MRKFFVFTFLILALSVSGFSQEAKKTKDAKKSKVIKKITLPGVPEGKGHLAPALVYNGLVYASGQTPRDLMTGKYETGSPEAQTELALRNVEKVLKEAGSDLNQILQMTIYISDLKLWDAVNDTVKKVMGDHKPARTVIPVKDLYSGTMIEIQVIAAVKE